MKTEDKIPVAGLFHRIRSSLVRLLYPGRLRKRNLAVALNCFSSDQLNHAVIEGRQLIFLGVTFIVDKSTLRLQKSPDTPWLTEILPTLSEDRAVWEVVAYLKTRVLSDAGETTQAARTGDLYNEDYYTRRGGGGPYTGYSENADLNTYFFSTKYWDKIPFV